MWRSCVWVTDIPSAHAHYRRFLKRGNPAQTGTRRGLDGIRHHDPAEKSEARSGTLRRSAGIRGVKGGRSPPLPVRNVQRCVGWLTTSNSREPALYQLPPPARR